MAANVSAVSRLRSCSGRRHQQGPRRVHQLWRRGVRAQRAPRDVGDEDGPVHYAPSHIDAAMRLV